VTGVTGEGIDRTVEVTVVEQPTPFGTRFGYAAPREETTAVAFRLFDDGWRVIPQ